MINIVNDPNTLLLLHGEDFTDSSIYGNTVTNNGVAVSTTQSKFGGKSLYFNGGSSKLTIKSDLFNFGSGDFTVDWWEYVTANPATRFTISYNAGWGGICAGGSSTTNKLYVSSVNPWDMLQADAFNTTKNTWVHWAVVRSGNKFYTFRNGAMYWSGNGSGAVFWNGAGLVVGAYPYDSSHYFGGYIDEFRISNVAQWTESFTPPTAPYVASTATITSGGIIPKKHALRRRMMASKPARLPKEYQEVKYLESTGTQYIDTGIKGKTGLVAIGEIMLTSSQTSIALGCYSPQRCYMLSFNANIPRYGYVDWYNGSTALAVNEKYSFEVSFLANSQYLKLNGSTVISSTKTTTFTNSYNLFAFAYNDTGPAGDHAKCRFYSLNLYDNGTLVREFIPCYRKADNVAGLYDFVNGVFYTNAGSGTFAVGSNV